MAGQHEFRLEQVLKFRKEVERMQQLELAQAKQQHDLARDRLKSEHAALATLEDELAELQQQGMEAKELQLYGDFALRKQQEIQALRDTLPGLEKAVQERRESLMIAAKEKKALEVFKEKKLRDLKLEQLNRERAFLDELAIQGRGQQ